MSVFDVPEYLSKFFEMSVQVGFVYVHEGVKEEGRGRCQEQLHRHPAQCNLHYFPLDENLGSKGTTYSSGSFLYD